MMRRWRLVVVAAAVLLAGAPGQAATVDLFAYDASRPLDVRETSSSVDNGVSTVELSYASPKGGRVPATLVAPVGRGRPPVVIFQHGAGNASRKDFAAEAQELARAGIASLAIDGPFARPGARNWVTFQLRDRNGYVQNAVDIRRGIDVVLARPELDASRVALVGHSYGGHLAGILAAVEPRLDAVVVMAGPGRMSDFLSREGQKWVRAGWSAKVRTTRKKQLGKYLAHMRVVDGTRYVGRAGAPLLFQFGRQDTFPKAWFERYAAAAPDPKRVEWYDAGHFLCDCATRDRKAWLLDQLGLA
jgi:dienelactone hydrolase